MEGIFTLCAIEEYTPEKVILYVKDLTDVRDNDWISSDVNHGIEFMVKRAEPVTAGCTAVDVHGATHKVTAFRQNPPDQFKMNLPEKGTRFILVSRAVGEFDDSMRKLGIIPIDATPTPALNIQVLREIIAGLENSAPYHYLVRCTPEQRRTLSASMRIDAEKCGLVVVAPEAQEVNNNKEPFDFIQWWTGARLYFEDADHFLVKACRIRERSIIGVDANYTHDAIVLHIEGNDVYVRAYTNDVRKDPYMGGEYKWEGKFIVLNY